MVPASRIDSTTITPAAIRNSLKIAAARPSTMSSMSPPWVDSSSAPRTARKRCTGTATETMTSPRSLMRTMLDLAPMQRAAPPRRSPCRSAGRARDRAADRRGRASVRNGVPARARSSSGCLRSAAAGRGAARRRELRLSRMRIAVAVVDARARLGRRDQPAQHRRDALRIDRRIRARSAPRPMGRSSRPAAVRAGGRGSMVVPSLSAVAEAAMAPAMISPCTSRLWTRASIRPARNCDR